jgi:hypothetical protein
MSVVLTSRTRRIKVFILPHDVYCAALGTCACTMTPERDARRLAASLTVPAGATIAGLPDAVLAVPHIQRAVDAGDIVVARVQTAHVALATGAPTRRTGVRSRGAR